MDIHVPKDSPVVTTRTTTYWLMDNGMLYSKVKKGAMTDINDAIENEQARIKLLNGKIAPLIIDIRGIKEISYEARKYSQKSGPTSSIYAAAIIVGSQISKVIGSFAIGLNQPIIPTKMFADVGKAVNWLEGIEVTGHPFMQKKG